MATNLKQTPIPVVPRNLKIVNADGTPTRSGQLLLQQLQPNNTIWGVHSDRPGAGDVPDGAIYVEANRGGVIYQNQGGEWHYLAGTMWGTISPDERPTDLGVNDTGFDFRTTISPSQEFMWSGNSWIEITALRYGTHAQRLATPVAPSAGLWSGAAWIETDRGNSIYQNQAGTWHYLAGTMFGTLSPDQRPADLGVNDAGFDFRTSVAPPREFMWSQSAWVEIASATGDVQQANSSANLGFTTAPLQIPGTVIVLNRAGRYLITGNYTIYLNDAPNVVHGDLFANGASYGSGIELQAANGTYLAASQQWLYTAGAAGQSIYLRGWKDGGAGNSSALAGFTSIAAQWISP